MTNRKRYKKNTYKQQQKDVVAVENAKTIELLTHTGFDHKIAAALCILGSHNEIAQQIAWIDLRNPRDNRLGLLRRAIEESWSPPAGFEVGQEMQAARVREKQRDARQEAKEAASNVELVAKHRTRREQLGKWNRLQHDERAKHYNDAIAKARSPSTRSRLQRQRDFDNPPTEVLAVMESNLAASIGGSSL